MKMNVKARLKNPYFWIGLGGVVLTAMGAEPAMFTDWSIVANKLHEVVSNPFMLGSVAVAVSGVFFDPSTKGLGD